MLGLVLLGLVLPRGQYHRPKRGLLDGREIETEMDGQRQCLGESICGLPLEVSLVLASVVYMTFVSLLTSGFHCSLTTCSLQRDEKFQRHRLISST